jgi:PAS domain S-box-containing protein
MISEINYLNIFRRLPNGVLILKANPPHFSILDFNDEYVKATNLSRSAAIGKDLFIQFPDNPNDPNATGVRNLNASLMYVIQKKELHKMSIQKYDIPIPGSSKFEMRYWSPENVPVFDDSGKVEYIIHTVVDVTPTIILEEKQKEAQLEIANLSVILSKTHNAVVLADDEEKVQWVNDAFINLLEVREEEVVGKLFLDVLKRVAHNSSHCDIEQSIALRQPMECEVENPNSNGDWDFAKLETQPILSESTGVNAFFAMITDISEIKKAESIILKNELRNRFILANISDGITIMNPEGIVTEVSPSGLKIMGHEEAELVGKYRPDLIHPEDLAMVNGAFKETVLDNPKKTIQFRFKLPDGRYKWLESTYHNFCDEPAIQGVVLTYRDISERKTQEAFLKASEQNYKYLFENNPAAILIWDPATFKVIECNQAAEVLTGYSRNELKNNMTVFDYRPEEEHQKIRELENRLEEVQSVHSTSSLLISKNGELLHTDNSYHRIIFYGKKLILALMLNVTDKVKLEKQIEFQKNRKHFEITDAVLSAQENERAHLGRELHDNINQILTTARLYIEYALSEEKMRIQLMENSRDFIISAIKEVRELSKTLVPASLDENGLTNALEDLIQKVKLLNTIEITTKYVFNEALLSTKFRLAIFRIIQEQLNNIIKHSKASRASIILKQSASDLILVISDNGIGFDPSTRNDGLGFKNIMSRATLHQGLVSINSSFGKGCELQIKFQNQLA